MKIIITGASGFIGSNLVSAFAKKHKLTCLVRDANGITSKDKIDIIAGNLKDPDVFKFLPKRADAIIHLAQSNLHFPNEANELFMVNTLSTQRLADYGQRAGISRFIYASSGNVYAHNIDPLSENSRRQFADFYSLSKICSEDILYCYKNFFHICILRLFAPYGPGQKNRLIPKIIDIARRKKPVVLNNNGQPKFNPIYIDDLLIILEQSLSIKNFQIVNVAGPVVINIKDIANIAGRVLGVEPRFENRNTPETFNLIADTKKLHRLFNPGKLTTPEQGIMKMLNGASV